jgi:hypothetical protein
MFFIYVSELQEEAPMENHPCKRGKEVYIGSPILIYMMSCREYKRREIVRERDQEQNIRSMKIGGVHEFKKRLFREGIPIGGVTLFPMMSKEEKEKDQKRNIRSMKTWGESPKGDTLFHLCQRGRET